MGRVLLVMIALLLLTACSAVVENGDTVFVTYTGTFTNGTIFDANDASKTNEYPVSHTDDLKVTVGKGQVIAGFDTALLNMKQGETKTVTIKARDAYGGYDSEKIFSVPKQFVLPKDVVLQRVITTLKTDLLLKTGSNDIRVGQLLPSKNFVYNVTFMNETHVILYAEVKNTTLQLDDTEWESVLVSTTSETFVFRQQITQGTLYSLDSGPYIATVNETDIVFTTAFQFGQSYRLPGGVGRVSRENMNSVIIDFNHPLAGNNLVFTITVNMVEKRKQ